MCTLLAVLGVPSCMSAAHNARGLGAFGRAGCPQDKTCPRQNTTLCQWVTLWILSFVSERRCNTMLRLGSLHTNPVLVMPPPTEHHPVPREHPEEARVPPQRPEGVTVPTLSWLSESASRPRSEKMPLTVPRACSMPTDLQQRCARHTDRKCVSTHCSQAQQHCQSANFEGCRCSLGLRTQLLQLLLDAPHDEPDQQQQAAASWHRGHWRAIAASSKVQECDREHRGCQVRREACLGTAEQSVLCQQPGSGTLT
jgi:hypothetical protein